MPEWPTAARAIWRAPSTEPNCPVVGVSIGTYSFRYWHAFGVDDAAISHKQSLARAKSCSQCGSLFLSTNGSFLVSAEGGTNLGSETTREACFGTKHPHDLRNRTGGLESAFPNPRNPRNPRLIKPRRMDSTEDSFFPQQNRFWYNKIVFGAKWFNILQDV